MARVAITEGIRSLINSARETNDLTEQEIASLDNDLAQGSLSLKSLVAIKRYTSKNPQKSLSSCFVGTGAVLQFPRKELPPEPPEVMEGKRQRKEHLERIQQTKEYNQMVFGSQHDPVVQNRVNELSSFHSYRTQASVGANVIVSAGGMGIVFYFISHSFIDNKQHVRRTFLLRLTIYSIISLEYFSVVLTRWLCWSCADAHTGNDIVYREDNQSGCCC